MNPDRWRRIEELFDRVADMKEEERASLLDRECGEDQVLHSQVESLILSSQKADTYIHSAIHNAADAIASAEPSLPEGLQIGRYRIVRELGRGGMGAVYLATRADDEFRKEVAIKLVKAGAATEETLRRFRSERQILANLDHPNIARLLDGGTTDTGVPYVVMEYVEGEPLDAYADRNHLNIRERLLLFRKVCSAVQSAHQNLVVHRDIKPANILVTKEGEPKLLDFGIAKLTAPEDSLPSAMQTRADLRLMTPDYASPEQVRGETITTACDIYSLGIVFFELLTGLRPYWFKEYTPQEIISVICEKEPDKPSTAVHRLPANAEASVSPESISTNRRTTPVRLKRRLHGDLDNIALMALRKEPKRRYVSVEQMSEDIRRHLEGLPIMARPATFLYRTHKFMGRHAAAVSAACIVILVIAGLVGFYTHQLANERDRAQTEAEKAKQVSAFLTDLFKVSDPGESRGKTITAQELLERGAARIDKELADQPEVQAEMMAVIGSVYQSLGLYHNAMPLFEKALEIRKRIHGPSHPDVAASVNSLALVTQDLGDYPKAEKLFRQGLAMRRGLLGESHADVAESLNDLASLDVEIGNYKAAEQLNREAWSIRRKLFGDESLQAAESMSDLGDVLHETGDYKTAIELQRKALEIRRKLLGENHPLVTQSLQSLAVALDTTGDHDTAVGLYRQALGIQKKLYGEEHPEIATTMVDLARVLRHTKDYAEAETLYRKALEMDRKLRGKNHPYVAYDLNSLATLLYLKGDLAAADPVYREAISLYRQNSEDDSLAPALVGYGSLLTELGHPRKAEPLLREGVERWRKMVPAGHWRIAVSESALAGCLIQLQHLDEAERLLLQGFEILQNKRGIQSVEAQRTLKRLVELYKIRNKPETVSKYQALLAAPVSGSETN